MADEKKISKENKLKPGEVNDRLDLLEKEESGSDKKIDKFALTHIKKMKEKKANADQIKKFISENKKKFEKSKKEDDVKKTKDSDYAKKSMKTDLFVQGRSPEKFPGFDQADRIRGGLKKGGRVKKRKNTRRMNRLEELGRVDAEKGFTKKGKKNLKAEKKRIVRELKSSGGSAGAAIRGKGCEIR